MSNISPELIAILLVGVSLYAAIGPQLLALRRDLNAQREELNGKIDAYGAKLDALARDLVRLAREVSVLRGGFRGRLGLADPPPPDSCGT